MRYYNATVFFVEFDHLEFSCFAMIASGESKIMEVYVIANGPKPVPPCGGCRQKIAEFADPDVIVTLSNLAGDEEKFTVKDLLPGVFTKDHMD